MRKYTRTDGEAKILSPQAHRAVDAELKRLGKTSARDLTESERNSLQNVVDDSGE